MNTKKLNAVTTVTTVSSDQKFPIFDANGNVKSVSLSTLKTAVAGGLNLNAIEDGVFIMYHRASDNYPLMVKPHKWPSLEASGEIADGVVIFEGGKHLVVAPTEASALTWSSAAVACDTPTYNNDESYSAQVTGNNRLAAMLDFDGRKHTDAIIKASSSGHVTNTTSYAAGYCRAYSRANSKGKGLTAGYWWLPSIGEMLMIYANMLKINYALSLIKGATQLVENWYWTSTEFGASPAWYLYLSDGHLNYWYDKVKDAGHVRAVSAFLR